MPRNTKSRSESSERAGGAGGEGGEPGGRPGRAGGAARGSAGALAGLAPGVRDRLSDELVDELLAGARSEEEIVGPGGLLADLTKRLVERAMSAELTEHLGFEPHQEPPGGAPNTRNGSSPKTLVTEHGPVPINAPRDRDGSFEPRIVSKRQRRFEGFDDKILALYARGLSTRDIEAHLREIYGVSVGRDLVSRVTDEVSYIPFDPEAANLMFSLVSARYERASMIVTSNKPLSGWGEIFGDEVVAVIASCTTRRSSR